MSTDPDAPEPGSGDSPHPGGRPPRPEPGQNVPRPPAHAWRWLQRSRPVLRTIAERLTGGPPTAGFVDELRRAFDTDPFTRTIVVDVIAEVAFGGRVPRRQPAGASWDRGLRWWAATLAGVDVAEFDGPATPAAQPDLFDPDAAGSSPQAETLAVAARRQVPRTTPERLALARTLRELLAASEGGQVPASAVRQLIDALEGDEPLPDQTDHHS